LSTGKKIAALKKLTPAQLRQIASLFALLKTSRVRLPRNVRARLTRPKYKSRIRQLVATLKNKAGAQRVAKQVREQTGGFWGILLSTVLPIAAQYLYDKLK
jgi:alanine-alpha-ketoisovalerate/valine-pyruvate aminotransferase